MNIGVLLCDNVDAEVQKQYGTYNDFFKSFISHSEPSARIKYYQVNQGEFPEKLTGHDAYMISGSRRSCYEDEPWIKQLLVLIKKMSKAHVKIYGICFGHQAIAEALGGKVEKNKAGWGLGVHDFDAEAGLIWAEPYKAKASMVVSCQDQVVKLPHDAEVYLSTPFIKHGGYFIGKNIITTQAHPEMNHEYGKYLLSKRVKAQVISAEQAKEDTATFSKPLDNALISRWVHNFLKQ